MHCTSEEELKASMDIEEKALSASEQLRLWVSYRGQTLTRTGMEVIFEYMGYTMFLFVLTNIQGRRVVCSYLSTFSSFLLPKCFKIFTVSAYSMYYFIFKLPVRGMMYYRKALELQAFLDMARDEGMYFYKGTSAYFY